MYLGTLLPELQLCSNVLLKDIATMNESHEFLLI